MKVIQSWGGREGEIHEEINRRNAKWRQACRTLVGGYVMGMCPGRSYFTGEEWVSLPEQGVFSNLVFEATFKSFK